MQIIGPQQRQIVAITQRLNPRRRILADVRGCPLPQSAVRDARL
ncbi:MAG TPA: hypothetical protein VK816_09245 [Jatrophihabitantaceae bacterium]|nr:hypothetical protein [Jatrophihabitantaceae bacterium]